jgi:transposase InsO family protein
VTIERAVGVLNRVRDLHGNNSMNAAHFATPVVAGQVEGRVAVTTLNPQEAGPPPASTQMQADNRRASEPVQLVEDAILIGESAMFVVEQQRADPCISKIVELLERDSAQPSWDEVAPCSENAKSLWRQWSRLALRDGVLVRRFEEANGRGGHWQVIVPKQMRAKFIAEVHAGVTGGHFGRHRTELAVQARAYWPGWAGDVRRALRACEACAKYMRSKPPRQVALKPILCGEPWELLSLDITGPHPVSKQGFTYILTMQDHFSKWAEAVPIRRHTAPIVARAVFEQVFMRFGAPRRLLCDQGPEFESELIAELCRLMRIDKIRTSPYRPQSNGMLERFHRVLNAMLAKVVDEDQRNWPDHLPSVMAAYRASVHEATGYTPNYLILGREARLPIDLVFGVPPDREGETWSYDNFVNDRAERVADDFRSVRERLGRLAQVRVDKYVIKKNVPPLKVGQKVWYFCPRRRPTRSPKWQNFYTGPFKVVRIIDPHVIVISRSNRSRPITVHRDKLKPVVENDESALPEHPFGERRAGTENLMDDDAFSESNGCLEANRPKRERRTPKKYQDFCRRCVVDMCDAGTGEEATEMQRQDPAADHPPFACTGCDMTFRDAHDLDRHRRTKAHAARESGQQPAGRSIGGLSRHRQTKVQPPVVADAASCVTKFVRTVTVASVDDESSSSVGHSRLP